MVDTAEVASAGTTRAEVSAVSAAEIREAAEQRATGESMERLLGELVEKLHKAHGGTLVSVVLYGSAATSEGRDIMSDFNVLCVLRQVTATELHASEPIFRWWREMKNPAPLLLSEDEVRNATDCFPIEFHDIREHHRILYGDDVAAGIVVDDSFYRAQVEHELRAKILRLRQKAGGLLSERDLLLRLMCESVSTFCVLFRHALRLAGEQPLFGKHEVVAAVNRRFGASVEPFELLLALREGRKKPKDAPNATALFTSYLQQIEVVVHAVDQMAK
jgi:hypothetical protein